MIFANGVATYYLAENCVANITFYISGIVIYGSNHIKLTFEPGIAQEVCNVNISVINNFKD